MVTRGDFMEQQIPFIMETKRMLASGMPYWDWNTFLGANFFGSYSFYTLGSPFVWLLMPLPEAAIPYGISVMAVLKHAVAAMTAFWFLRRFVKEPRHAKIGALLYAFSSFSIINTQFYHFMDVVAVFPLLMLGLENAFVGKRRHGALALASALNAMVNYYFFAGTALFVVFYTAFRFFSKDWREELPFRRRVWRLVGAGFECGLGCLMVAWILMPAGWAMMGVSRSGALQVPNYYGFYTWSNTLERLRALWMPIDSNVVHAFFGDASSWASVAAFLPLFGCALVVWHALARRKGWIHLLLVFLVFISIWPLANRAFTLGSSIFYTRWWYGLVLMLCIPTVQALEALPQRNPRDLRWMNVALVLTLLGSLLFTVHTLLPVSFLERLAASAREPFSWFGKAVLANRKQPLYASDAFRILGFTLAGLNLLGLWLVTRKRFLGNVRVLYAALSVAIIANYAGFIAVNDALVPLASQDGYATGVDYYARRILVDERPAFVGTTYTHRIDAPPKIRNYGMLINQPAVTSFHSLRSSYLDYFLVASGYGHIESPDAVPPNQTDAAFRSVLGVAYYYNYDEEHYPGAPEGFIPIDQVGEVTVYENPNALPLGFAYDYFTSYWRSHPNRDNIGALMAQAVILGGAEVDELRDILEPIWDIELLPWQEAVKERAAQGCYDVVANPGGLTAKIDLDREKLVFFSIQFDRGWSATVNGLPAELLNVNMGLMGLRVPAGEANEIALTYRPRGLREGMWVSLGGVLLFMCYCAVMRRPNKKRKEETNDG